MKWKEPMTLANVTILKDLHSLNDELRFQNNYESTDWFYVTITGFGYTSKMINGVEMYIPSMTLEESI